MPLRVRLPTARLTPLFVARMWHAARSASKTRTGHRHFIADDLHVCGGRDRRRSGDLPLFRRTLCRLSYSTVWACARAVPTGLEPATSGLTGRRELQLHHGTKWMTT